MVMLAQQWIRSGTDEAIAGGWPQLTTHQAPVPGASRLESSRPSVRVRGLLSGDASTFLLKQWQPFGE